MLDLSNEMSKKGVLDALNTILDSRKRKIQVSSDSDDQHKDVPQLKLPKNSEIISKDDPTIDEPTSQDPNQGQTSRQARIDKLTNLVKDPKALENELINIQFDNEERENKRIRASQEAARKALEASGRSMQGIQDFSVFSRDLEQAMKRQTAVNTKPEDTYSKVNPTYAKSDLLMPGSGYLEKRAVPVINVYWDKSGSLTSEDKDRGLDALSYLLQLQSRKKLKVKNYWFANSVVDSAEKSCGNGTHAFPKILKHIEETRADNVIIFTDKDFNNQTDFSSLEPITIRGCVWWIWCGSIADQAVPYIKTRLRSNVFEYQMR